MSSNGRAVVTYSDAEPSGLADLVGRLVEGNLRADPARATLLRPATIELRAIDAGVAVAVRLRPGSVTIAPADGASDPDLVVAATSADLLELAAAPLVLGLPDPRSREGRALLSGLLSRRVAIAGMLRHPIVLTRFARLLSVADRGRR